MNFRQRIEAIRRGYELSELAYDEALRAFETTLRLYGLLEPGQKFPENVQEDRFLGLLDVAEEEYPHLGEPPAGRLLGLKVCPACRQDAPRLYNSFQAASGGPAHMVQPPRCARCMLVWVRQNLPDMFLKVMGAAQNLPDEQPDGGLPLEEPSVTPDDSPAPPMESQEERFFRQYEGEMDGFKP